MKSTAIAIDNYVAGNAWFTCDRCSTRYRRSDMLTEWDLLKVCEECLDPRPPYMQALPVDLATEGVPFRDPRPPLDGNNMLQDTSYLLPTLGGMGVTYVTPPNASVGALSPQNVLAYPAVTNVATVADDVTILTGPVFPEDAPGAN